ncbi:MAG: cytochrome c biogenesis protein CcsA, partial [Candidatus Hydrothermarchaeales archaeon]
MAGQPGDILLIGALIFSIASAFAWAGKKDKNGLNQYLEKWGLRFAASFLTLSLLLLSYYFLRPDFNFLYVFDRASAATPGVYRLSAMWAGQAGTFLMWAWVIMLSALFIGEKKGVSATVTREGMAIILLGGAFFTFMALMAGPFNPTMDRIGGEAFGSGVSVKNVLEGYKSAGFYVDGKGFVDGMGLSPMLQTPYNAVHPPLMFIAYGLVFVVFSVSLVYLVRGQGDWERAGRTWARVSWLLMTAAMAIGGLWAYEELAYGGYWTWDPIEAASLLPWLTLTAYLHGSIEFRRRGKLGALIPLLGVLTTLLIVYSTYITRSGIIKSSHSYSGTSSANYLIIAVLALTAAAAYFTIKRTSWRPEPRGFNLFSQSTLLQLSILGILAAAAVVFWGLTGPVIAKVLGGADVATPPDFYNQKGYLAVVFILFIMGVNGFLGYFKKSVLFRVSAAAIIVSVLFYAAAVPSANGYVNLIAPLILFALGSLIYRTVKAWNGSGFSHAFLKNLFSDLAHIGIVLVVAGAVVSGALSTTYELVVDYNSDRGRIMEMGDGYSVRLDDIKVFQDSRGGWVQESYVTVIKSGTIKGSGVLRMVEHRHTPFILRVGSDVYGIFMGIQHLSGGAVAV